jgi:hypothetical protein
MAEPPIRKTEATPEGRGCLYLSLALVLIAVLAFAIAAWINAPSASPAPSSGGTPPTAPTS